MSIRERLIGTLYLSVSLSLALFCLFQSQSVGHDQRARDLAGRSIHSSPKQHAFTQKKIGEGSD